MNVNMWNSTKAHFISEHQPVVIAQSIAKTIVHSCQMTIDEWENKAHNNRLSNKRLPLWEFQQKPNELQINGKKHNFLFIM